MKVLQVYLNDEAIVYKLPSNWSNLENTLLSKDNKGSCDVEQDHEFWAYW